MTLHPLTAALIVAVSFVATLAGITATRAVLTARRHQTPTGAALRGSRTAPAGHQASA